MGATMYSSSALTSATAAWTAAADSLLDEAQRIAPLRKGRLLIEESDEANEAQAARIEQQVEAMLAEGDRVWSELEGGLSTSDGRFQAGSFLMGTLALGDSLQAADPAPDDTMEPIDARLIQVDTFANARMLVSHTSAVLTTPDALETNLEQIETCGANESWKLLSGAAGKLAGGALVSGLEGILSGAAAAAFSELKKLVTRWWEVLKKAALRIMEWVIEKVKKLLPDALGDKVDKLVEQMQEWLTNSAGAAATDAYGRLLGRGDTEAAWEKARASGKDLTEAESNLAGIVEAHTGRIGWVTKGRTLVERYDSIVAGVVGAAPDLVKVGFAALVAACLGFVAIQVSDGFNDIEALV